MITKEKFFGGARVLELGADESQRIHPDVAKLWCVNTTGAGALVSLPRPEDLVLLSLGQPLIAVENIGLTQPLVVEDSNGDAVATIDAGDIVILCLIEFSPPAGLWSALIHSVP